MTSTAAKRLAPHCLSVILLLLFSWTASSAHAVSDQRIQWNKKWGPLVPHKTFPKNCNLCHVPKRWDVLRSDFRFDHLKETGYALDGSHAQAACLRCHNDRGVVSAYVARGCGGCHMDPHRGQLGIDCKRCHNQINWNPTQSAIGQHAQTRFPLTGLHATVQCQQCHARSQAGDFKGAPVDCFSCHQADFNKAPNHLAMNFSHDCRTCHNTTSFANATFDHSTLGANPNCYSCHQKDYQTTQNPNHATLGFPTLCANCHNTSTWLGATFNHASTGFALTGRHATAQCTDCHVGNNYNLPNANCVPCHQADYNGAISPVNHPAAAASFPVSACQNCHGDYTAWTNARFDHATTGFALTGKHASAQCTDCHVGNNYNLPNANCVPCHQADYNGAISPVNHPAAAASFPVAACKTCHGDYTSWRNAKFDHSTTGFALTGLHAVPPRACVDCHIGNNYNLTNTTCLSCHQTDYNNATSPLNHSLSTLTNCQNCHSPATVWSAPTYTHSSAGGAGSKPWDHNNARTCAVCHNATGGYPTAGSGWFTCAGNGAIPAARCHTGTAPNTLFRD